jgi:hypothetical protein
MAVRLPASAKDLDRIDYICKAGALRLTLRLVSSCVVSSDSHAEAGSYAVPLIAGGGFGD